MTDQITEPARITRRYYKPTCWFWCIIGLACTMLCVWLTLVSYTYKNIHTASQDVLSPIASFDPLSYKHLYSAHEPTYLAIHVGNNSPASNKNVPVSALLRLPTHLHSSPPVPLSTPQRVHTGKSANAKTLSASLATNTPGALSFSLHPAATLIPTATPIPTSTPVASLSTIPQQSAPLPPSSVEASPTPTPLPTLTIQATPIQGDATPQSTPTKSASLQFPEPGTPVSGHRRNK